MLNIKMLKKICFVLIILFGAFNTMAQGQWEDEGEIRDSEIIIEKDRKIELGVANRNFEKVPPLPETTQRSQLSYKFADFEYNAKPIEPAIRVLTLQEDKLTKLYGNYLKAGFGNYGTPYLETFLNSKRDKNYAYGVHYKHLSSSRGPVAEGNSGSATNAAQIYGKAMSKTMSLSGDVFYKHDKVHFYGYNPIWDFEPDSIKQVIQRVGINAQLLNIKKGAKTDYNLSTGFEYLKDDYGTSEINFDLSADLDYALNDKLRAFLKTDLWLSQLQNANTANRNLFRILPGFKFDVVGINIAAGLNMVYENDTLTDMGKLHVYPSVWADYGLSESVKAYAGFEGDVQKNNLSQMLTENPFLVQGVGLGHTNKLFEFKAGLKGKMLNTVSFHAGLSTGRYQNMYLYNLAATDTSRFSVEYDNGQASKTDFFGEVSINKEEKFRSILRGNYFRYKMDLQAEAWHRPEYAFSWLNTVNLYDKILVNADAYVLGGMKALSPSQETIELKPIFDLNLKFDYMFTPKASAFISMNNILSKNYQRYLNYEARGFQIMAGISYTF